ncbi:sensor histidine kinase [Phormidium sp. CLA17]|uniref:sensor histidine kinase n=1 Tax=Leptolyngbya sp. Cla-17 TaxID=2803751 RepID=UPI00149247EE|nr:HAMP domain-containing sensor histidine kinase [Leptolyngbya sp. Cla-17]MBM0742381.1 sensor histidine kinase [Leptolyngbya sp. Cla-17]
MFQATRRRLALWYTAVTAVLLLLFASGVFLYVRTTLIERVDDTLNHVVEVVRRSLVIEQTDLPTEGGRLRVNIEASFRNNAATAEADRIDIEWFSPMGELLWSTLSAPLQVPLRSTPNGETVRITPKNSPDAIRETLAKLSTDLPAEIDRLTLASVSQISEPLVLRQVTQRVELEQQVLGYLRVSHPWFEVTKPSREFFFDLAVGTGLMVGAVGAIGWFLSGLAMQPIRESYQRLKQFTADASHELRSPIAVIQTNVQVALADPDPDPLIQQHHLQVVERLTRRLGRLVDDLLFLARQDSGSVQAQWLTVDLELLLEEVIEEQQILASEKEIAITLQRVEPIKEPEVTTSLVAPAPAEMTGQATAIMTKLPSKSWAVVQGDRDQLFRLFTNLIGNAVKYTPAGGAVSLNLQRVGRQNHSSLQVTITDTGIGIPPEALPYLFDRFYRVDPARSQASAKGSGLGLAIAQAIVQNHQGQIHITGIPNQGTTATVTLPLRQEEVKG